MEIPQMVMIGMLGLSVGVGLAMHGKPRKPLTFWSVAIGAGLEAAILYWGGFWS